MIRVAEGPNARHACDHRPAQTARVTDDHRRVGHAENPARVDRLGWIDDSVTGGNSRPDLLRSHGARVYNLADEPRGSAIFKRNGTITLCTDSRTILVLSDGYNRPSSTQPPGWLHCFSGKARAVKESYVRALAEAGFDFDGVELEDHLVYEPGTRNPRPV